MSISTGSTFGISAKELQICRMYLEGAKEKEIMLCVYGVGEDSTDTERRKARNKLRDVIRNPKVQECYRAMLRERAMPATGAAMNKLMEQLDDKSGWLANKAANDVLNKFWPVMMGEEDHSIVVKVEGMPQLGTPDEE